MIDSQGNPGTGGNVIGVDTEIELDVVNAAGVVECVLMSAAVTAVEVLTTVDG